VAEARLVDFARMKLRPVRCTPNSIKADLSSKVKAEAPFATPWRVVMVGDSAGQLLEKNHIILNMNDPCEIEDTSWIKPGKIIRDISLTTTGAMACVDFAAARGMQYIEFDAGWYGPEWSIRSDARTVTVDPKRSKGPLDLHAVIKHANEQDIGIWLYVNRHHLEQMHEELFALFHKWGIKGVKFGFVRVGSQKWTDWVHKALRKAAEYELMVDIHDEYRPTGYERTYPNLLTQEGIRGNEEMPTAEHNCYLPFTRYLCGAGDYTICWNSQRIKTSHAHQLAASMVMYSPLQFLYWYDRPAEIKDAPQLSFFDHLPMVWDESRVLGGEVGKYITIARRSGDDWFLCTLNGGEQRGLEIPLDFLGSGKFEAQIYSDAHPDGSKPREVLSETKTVTAGDSIKTVCSHNGGQAVRLAAS
jgi:alpha-glucosidase